MCMVNDKRFFAAVLLGTVVCLFATVCHAFPFPPQTFPASPHHIRICDTSVSFPSALMIGTPVRQPAGAADYSELQYGRQDHARPHTVTPTAFRLDVMSTGVSANGHRKDGKTAPPQNKAVSGILSAFSFRYISLPSDGMFIGIPLDPRGLPGKRSGDLRAGP